MNINIEPTTFSVAVISTMSSGKSTILNAMFGTPLLPSKNEACTAIITRLEDIDGMKNTVARCTSKIGLVSDWRIINDENKSMLSDWNNANNVLIEIQGNFSNIDNYYKHIEFIDTPGPNNSMDHSHAQITHQIIEDNENSFIIYIMNATQFGVDDERNLLEKLAELLKSNNKESKIVFVVNKFDEFDIDLGECPSDFISKVKSYLNELGFYKPIIIPTMGLISLQIRQCISAARNGMHLPFKERTQRKLANAIDLVTEHGHSYLEALANTQKKYEYLTLALAQDRNIDQEYAINIGNRKYKVKDLIEVDILCGIPFLEEMLELELMKQ